mmetsp:Transcript_59602/g.126698  ORF Transcript_59602/g.126698 Transcript_59602/m.126698 type:complete len:111 (+) Transcript_59602:469-801(+)
MRVDARKTGPGERPRDAASTRRRGKRRWPTNGSGSCDGTDEVDASGIALTDLCGENTAAKGADVVAVRPSTLMSTNGRKGRQPSTRAEETAETRVVPTRQSARRRGQLHG